MTYFTALTRLIFYLDRVKREGTEISQSLHAVGHGDLAAETSTRFVLEADEILDKMQASLKVEQARRKTSGG